MAYIGWATNVNKIILDSTSVTVGENAAIQDSLETGGQKKKRLVRENVPDKYSVTMKFDFTEESKDSNGLTELDRFWVWYKWVHCYGVNPFRFPAILLNSNRQTGWGDEEREHMANRQQVSVEDIPDYEYYTITSAAEGSKSGTDCQITMTWETYATGVIQVEDDESVIDHISAENGYVDVVLTSIPGTEPTDTTWTLYIDDSQKTITGCIFDGDVTTRLFFEKLSTGTVHTARILTFTSQFRE